MGERLGDSWQKIGVDSNVFVENAGLSMRVASDMGNPSFGAQELYDIKRLLTKNGSAREPQEVQKLKERLAKELNAVAAMFSSPSRFDAIVNFFNGIYEDPRFRERLDSAFEQYQTLLKDSRYRVLLPRMIDELPTDLFIEILEARKKRFEDQSAAFAEDLPGMKERFRQRIQEKVSSGLITLPMERVDTMLALNSFALEDDLRVEMEDKGGMYDSGFHAVGVSSGLSVERREWVFTHECLHALSGRTVLARSVDYDAPEEKQLYDVEIQRLGTRFGGSGKELDTTVKFKWLNEAITQWLTEQLGDPEKRVYVDEKNMLHRLCAKVPRAMFIEAYFEDYDPDNPQPIPKWKALWNRVNQAFGQDHLLVLDEKYKAHQKQKADEKRRKIEAGLEEVFPPIKR